MGLVIPAFMTLTESPFWRRWGMSGVAEWQINWVTLSVLRINPANRDQTGSRRPLWKVIASHLIHGMIAAIVFVLVLPAVLSAFPSASSSIVLVAMGFSLTLWYIFSVGLKKVYERARGIHIQRRGQARQPFVPLSLWSLVGCVRGGLPSSNALTFRKFLFYISFGRPGKLEAQIP